MKDNVWFVERYKDFILSDNRDLKCLDNAIEKLIKSTKNTKGLKRNIRIEFMFFLKLKKINTI